jgi:hypothetical protein
LNGRHDQGGLQEGGEGSTSRSRVSAG